VDFTREPIIETIVTAKDGYNLVVRSSKSTGQDEYFVEAVEIVSFGGALFFRSQEKSRAFLVPVSDYEVVEVREARMVLKTATIERNVKIGGGKESKEIPTKQSKELDKELDKEERIVPQEMDEGSAESDASSQSKVDPKGDKKKERRSRYRRKRGRDDKEDAKDENGDLQASSETNKENSENISQDSGNGQETQLNPVVLSALLQPPTTLISETINRYRQNDLFKAAFYLNEEDHYKPHDKVQELLDDEGGTDSYDSSSEEAYQNQPQSQDQSQKQEQEFDHQEHHEDQRHQDQSGHVHVQDAEEGSTYAMSFPQDAEDTDDDVNDREKESVEEKNEANVKEIALPPIPSHRDFPSFNEDHSAEKIVDKSE
jgi:hypothetical protein